MNRIRALIVMFAVSLAMGVSNVGRCHAEESLFLDDDSRYPLVFAQEDTFEYLDLDSCTVISGDEDEFEISARYYSRYEGRRAAGPEAKEHTCRFRKNEASGWKLQFWNGGWTTFIDPHDKDTIEKMLDEKGSVSFGLSRYYKFKCVYQQIFGKPYEDGWDDEALERTVIVFPSEDEPEHHRYLLDDENYPGIWSHYWEGAWYTDNSSVYVEMEDSSQCILRILAFHMPRFHSNDVMIGNIYSYRFLYDKEEGKMYAWWWPSKKWTYFSPYANGTIDRRVNYIGWRAYDLAYGNHFYRLSAEYNKK